MVLKWPLIFDTGKEILDGHCLVLPGDIALQVSRVYMWDMVLNLAMTLWRICIVTASSYNGLEMYIFVCNLTKYLF